MWSYVVLKILRASYICMNGLTQLVSGYSLSSGHSQERQNMIECYERSAHVIKIKLKRRKFELEGPTLAHFVLRNENKFSKKTKLLASGFFWPKIGFEFEFAGIGQKIYSLLVFPELLKFQSNYLIK